MPHYLRLGELPRKHHVKFPRPAAASFKGEGLHYEHIITTEGFDRAYSILYHQKPPTRVKSVELLRECNLHPAAPSPLSIVTEPSGRRRVLMNAGSTDCGSA